MLFALELELELELELVVDAIGSVSSVGLSGVLSVDLFLLERRRADFGLSSRSLSALEMLLARGIILYIQDSWTLTQSSRFCRDVLFWRYLEAPVQESRL
jgi:hypothetical protein